MAKVEPGCLFKNPACCMWPRLPAGANAGWKPGPHLFNRLLVVNLGQLARVDELHANAVPAPGEQPAASHDAFNPRPVG